MKHTKPSERFSELNGYLKSEYNIPGVFFEPYADANISCLFLVSCLNADRVLFIEDSFELITGYPVRNIQKAGMDFWFPLIHPDDLPMVTEKIIRSHEAVLKPGFNKNELAPLVLEYRFKNSCGEWCKLKDTKYLLITNDEIVIDKILCRFDLLDSNKDLTNVENMVKQNKSCTKMLEFALLHKNAQAKQPLTDQESLTKTSAEKPQLTKREKEILLLIGEGLSTKMIADKCSISINTVETHRRHLLEKLQAKNSMELIKEASKVFWL